ncbi:MAG: RCC1 repeat-containing protein, partial [Hymenobacter sp.]
MLLPFTFRLWVLTAVGVLLAGLASPALAQRTSLGGSHTLAIHTDGTLWAWGDNTDGQLGNNSTTGQTTPVQVGTATTWQTVSAGTNHSLAVRADGTLWAWGDNTYGQLGLGNYVSLVPAPVQVGTATTWRSVSAGQWYTLAVRTDGTLWAWGWNYYGQLGLGSSSSYPNVPTQVGTATNWRSTTAGAMHAAALRTDGTLWAWGSNYFGQLGTGSSSTGNELSPVQIGAATTWQSLDAGLYHVVALRTDGTLWAWGRNDRGQLGTGSTTSTSQPVQVGTATWQSVSAGDEHTVALRPTGTLWAWGRNHLNQLGLGASTERELSPVPAGNGQLWQTAAAGGDHTAALKNDATLWAWGYHCYGQVGNGAGRQFTPTQVGPGSTWLSVAGGYGHSLAVRADGTLWAWGDNNSGQLGTGTFSSLTIAPVQVGTATNWQSVAAADFSSFAVRRDGTLWAWGSNINGQLGLGNMTTRASPVQVGTAINWTSVSANYYHAVARVVILPRPSCPLMLLPQAQS